MQRLSTVLFAFLFPLLVVNLHGQVLLTENFEGSSLDPRITQWHIGTFTYLPGIKSTTVFGSTKAYGFGRSTCGASCFDNYRSALRITFSGPTYVSALVFKEIEMYGNWGGQGVIFLDGVRADPVNQLHFGRLPQNDFIADTYYRNVNFAVNKFVTIIDIGSSDITTQSENVIDDLQIIGYPNASPVALCTNVTVPAGPTCTANASVDNGSYDPDGDPITVTQSPSGPYPLGQTAVTLTVTDSKGESSQCTSTVTVVDQAAPVVIAASTATLWPPNHSYQTFSVTQMVANATDNCSGVQPGDAVITSVTSDEPEDAIGDGDGNTTDDIVIAQDCKSVQLRKERMGTGNGRVYTIHIRLADAAGNAATGLWYAKVPHNQGENAVDEGPVYGVTSGCSVAKLSIAAGPLAPFLLHPNYPNPAAPSTTISFTIPAPLHVRLAVYDALGRLVARLADREYSSGTHAVMWDGASATGELLPGGIYFYQISAGDFTATRRMFLAR